MNILGIIFQLIASSILVLAPAGILKQNKMRLSIGLSFIAIFLANFVGGLIASVPITFILLLFFVWVKFVGLEASGTKRTLFIITFVLAGLGVLSQIIHLPIRFVLGQSEFQIMTNVAGLFFSGAMFSGCVEFFLLQRRIQANPTASASLRT